MTYDVRVSPSSLPTTSLSASPKFIEVRVLDTYASSLAATVRDEAMVGDDMTCVDGLPVHFLHQHTNFYFLQTVLL